MNRILRSDGIVPHIALLNKRIYERFPERNLAKTCETFCSLAQEAEEQADEIARPNIPLRIGIGILVALIVAILAAGLITMDISLSEFGFLDLVTLIEAGINDIVFISAGIIFLVSIETRIKRRKSLAKLNELRSLAHIIDMHQLTKDPGRIIKMGVDTESSPKQHMTPFELTRYLDYCSEMLSLIGKVSMLFVQNFDDQVVLGTVNEIETLTTGLSRKIWQKIMIIHQYESEGKV